MTTAPRGRYNVYDLLEMIATSLNAAVDISKMVGEPHPVKRARMEGGTLVVTTDDGRTFAVSGDCINY